MTIKTRIPVIVAAALFFPAALHAKPPVAPVNPVVDEYWGVKVTDPYRYMEKLDDPAVQKWIKGQADYTDSVLKRIPGRDALLARIKELDAGRPYEIFSIRRMPEGLLFYYRMAAEDNLPKLCQRDSLSGAEHLLLDPAKLTAVGGGHYSLSFFRPSPNGQYVLYGLAPSGSEQTILHVLEVATGKNLPDSIDRMEAEYTPPQWLPDGRSFFYSRLRLLPPETPPTEGYKQSRAFLHRLGANPDSDMTVFAMNIWPGVTMSEEDFPSLVMPPGSEYVIGKIKHGDANQLTLYAAPQSAITTSNTPWNKICDVEDSVTDFAVHKNQIYLMTSRRAPRFKVVRTGLSHPDMATAVEVIPTSRVVIEQVRAAEDALYVGTLNAGLDQVVRVGYETGTPLRLPLPDGATGEYLVSASGDVGGVYVSTASWIKGSGTYSYDPKTNTFTDTGLSPKGKFDDVAGFESMEVQVPSHDGVMVPLSIMYKSGIKLDGSHPTFLQGYGAYGLRLNGGVYFDPSRLAWLEKGGVIAVAHVRGGGEYGEEWHLAGQKLTKPNTWKDFIACGEYLVQKGYTSPARLCGQGGSAGGILIGRAVTERPDLFAAALFDVGCLDAVRMETTTNGVPNIPEFGTVTKEDEFHGLLAMSAYNHVQDGVAYPAVLLAHGINDPRVEPWMSAKMCARLQAASSSGKPILFRVDYDAGHGIGSTKEQYEVSLADKWSFLLWQCGAAGFQP